VDAIIYGTGFRATEFLSPMKITGRGGLDLNQAWHDGAEAYLGMTIAGFPNFYMLYGPNTNLGSNSIIFMIECQAKYIMQCLAEARARNLKRLEVRADVMRRYNEDIQAQLKDSVWAAGCHSWYHNDAGKVTNNWPGYTQTYRRRTEKLNLADYELVPA
jgi:cation diffusion facilitator CzcD-associated flavoprotein CzcO